MIKDNRNNEQIYGRNDMVMLNPNNKIYGSLGIADKYVMKTEEGTRLILNNPKLGKFGDVLTELNIYGRSEQKSTTGAQLANLPNTNNVTTNGVMWTSKDNVVTAIGETGENVSSTAIEIFYRMPIVAGNYHVSGSANNVAVYVRVLNSVGAYQYYSNTNFTLTGDERDVLLYLQVPRNTTVNSTIKVMLNKGDTSLPFEPYTGGIPSPSPDYPQEIKSVVNPMVRVFGGTLGNKLNNKQINWLIENMNIWHNNNHFVLYDKFGTHDSIRLVICVYENNTNNYLCIFIDVDGNITTGAYQISVINNDEFIYCNMLSINDVNNVSKVIDVDSNKTVGLPNNYQTVTLPYTLNAIPVNSGGNVTIDGQQYIADYVDVGHGKLVKTVYEYVFSGEERWRVSVDGAKYIERSITGNNGIMDSGRYKKCLCSCLIAGTMYEARNGENLISTQAYSSDGIVYNNRVWVSPNVETNKLTGEKVFLALMTQEEIPLTQEEIRVFKELVTYYPVTIVENNYNTWMKATYKSIESV